MIGRSGSGADGAQRTLSRSAEKRRGDRLAMLRDPEAEHPASRTGRSEPQRPPMRRVVRGAIGTIYALALLVVIGGLGFFAGSFLHFFNEVESFSTPPVSEVASADGIVVLTGGPQRLEAAGRLLEAGRADHLLVSGVNLRTTEPQIKRLLSIDDAAFSCCVELGFEARDTIGNAREAAAWFRRLTDDATGEVGRSDAPRLIVVTSNYHMRRALLELSRALPDVRLDAYAVKGIDLDREGWWREPAVLRLAFGEFAKLVFARSRDYPVAGRVLGSLLAPAPPAGREI